MGAEPFLADACRACAEVLRQRGAFGDRDRAGVFTARAVELATSLGMTRLQRRLAAGARCGTLHR
jgi:hypothetical protein